jgi:hypothetical protein
MRGDGVDAAPEVHVVREPEQLVLKVAGHGQAVQSVTPQGIVLHLTYRMMVLIVLCRQNGGPLIYLIDKYGSYLIKFL